MINLSVWQSVGGFCEEMFIDSVDFDICYLIKENGYKILRTNETALLHEVGKSQKKNFVDVKNWYLITHHYAVII